jgi:hypothetical protein
MTVALYVDEVTFEERVVAIQEAIDNGSAWRLEGAIGREAMDLIEAGCRGLFEGFRSELKAARSG